MRKCIVRWNEDSTRWSCGEYLMNSGVSFPATSEKCYHYKCKGRIELIQAQKEPEPEPVLEADSVLEPKLVCASDRCEDPVGENMKQHCTLRCRKRQNRRDYRARQRAKKNAT